MTTGASPDVEREKVARAIGEGLRQWTIEFNGGVITSGMKREMAESILRQPAILSALSSDRRVEEWLPIETAPKDRTRILMILKDPLPEPERTDLDAWYGVPFVARHPGVADDGFDMGWQFAAPVGQGGFPDRWIAGWRPLPAIRSLPVPGGER